MDVNSHVSPSLHPSNVIAIEGYDDVTCESVQDVLGAFEAAYGGLTDVHAAREAARNNPALTEAAQILVVADFADKHFKRIAAKFDAAAARTKAAIVDAERKLAQPLEGTGAGQYSTEIRSHVKSLSREDRSYFIKTALKEGDSKTLIAVLGAPSYLSGLSTAEKDVYTRQHHESMNPGLLKRLEVMRAAQSLMDARGGLIFGEMDKAIGASGMRVANLRAARTKAESAYTFKA